MTDFLTDVFAVSSPFSPHFEKGDGGDEVTAGVLLDRAADRIRSDLSDQPAVQARLLGVIGNIFIQRG